MPAGNAGGPSKIRRRGCISFGIAVIMMPAGSLGTPPGTIRIVIVARRPDAMKNLFYHLVAGLVRATSWVTFSRIEVREIGRAHV